MRRALTSVEQQTLQSFEVIIVDDGSTDGTGQYLAQGGHTKEFPGIPETVVIHNDRGEGAGHARNQALKCARGELIAFLDDDDEWMPDFLKAQAIRLQENPAAGASCAAHIEIDSQKRTHLPDLDRLFEYDSQLIYLLTESFVHSMSVLVARRSAFDKLGLLNQDLHVCHDWEWCARLLSAGYSILPPGSEALVKREIPGGLV
jgi:glycosyltransferase involved in cell wall biosynthesis